MRVANGRLRLFAGKGVGTDSQCGTSFCARAWAGHRSAQVDLYGAHGSQSAVCAQEAGGLSPLVTNKVVVNPRRMTSMRLASGSKKAFAGYILILCLFVKKARDSC